MARAHPGPVSGRLRLGAAFGGSVAAHLALIGALGVLAAPGLPEIDRSAGRLVARLVAVEAPAAKPPPAPRRAAAKPGGTLPALPAERYYAAHELDERPLILSHVEPAFPEEAGNASGRVRLELLLSATGSVDTIHVLHAEPAGLFEYAARDAFAEARFRPGMRGGTAVKSALTLELLFGEALPPDPRLSAQPEHARPANPNAVDAPDRAGIKKRSPKEPS